MLLLAPPVFADPAAGVLRATDVPVVFRLPAPIEQWQGLPGDDGTIHVVGGGANAVDIHVTADRAFQADLENIGVDEVVPLLPEPAQVSVLTDPRLGVVVDARRSPTDGAATSERVSEFAVRGGLVTVTVSGETTEDILGHLDILHPPVPRSELPFGLVTRPSGYSIDLADGWRGLTAEEVASVTDAPGVVGRTTRSVFADVTTLGEAPVFDCLSGVVGRDPIPVFPVGKAPEYLSHHVRRVRALAEAGVMRPIPVWRRAPDTGASLVEAKVDAAEGDLSVLRIGDRDAWVWRNGIQVDGQAMRLATVYTTWGPTALDCRMVAATDTAPAMVAFMAMVASLRVVDAEANPVAYTLGERYRLWWPFRHPALQLYWMIVPLGFGAIWLATREE